MHKLRGRKIIRDRYTLHWRWCCHCEEYMDQADYKEHQCTWIGIEIPDPKGEFYVTNFKAVELQNRKIMTCEKRQEYDTWKRNK